MHRSRRSKLLLAAATLWPAVYVVLFLGVASGIVFLAAAAPSPLGAEPPAWLFCVFPLHFLTIALLIGMTVYWGVDVYKNPRLQGDAKALWLVVVLLGSMVGQAVYFFLNVWPDPATG